MNKRRLGKTGALVTELGLGAWQLGGVWGTPFNQTEAAATLRTAREAGINCIDTADVYSDGQSERAIGSFIAGLDEKPFVITKTGRRLPSQTKEGYNESNLRRFIDDSRKNLGVETLDIVLLHCPPTDVYYMPEVFFLLDRIKADGAIRQYGVSVERIEEGLKALDYEGVAAVEIIFNMFRLRPAEYFFERAKQRDVGVIARVPLASGLLSGRYHERTVFNQADHRTFNRDGAAFDKGETFSGVEYRKGLAAVEALKKLFGTSELAPIALRWILMFDAVSMVIPGASSAAQVGMNTAAATLPPLTREQMDGVAGIYDEYIRNPVHYLW